MEELFELKSLEVSWGMGRGQEAPSPLVRVGIRLHQDNNACAVGNRRRGPADPEKEKEEGQVGFTIWARRMGGRRADIRVKPTRSSCSTAARHLSLTCSARAARPSPPTVDAGTRPTTGTRRDARKAGRLGLSCRDMCTRARTRAHADADRF